jgi:hypothetical protein
MVGYKIFEGAILGGWMRGGFVLYYKSRVAVTYSELILIAKKHGVVAVVEGPVVIPIHITHSSYFLHLLTRLLHQHSFDLRFPPYVTLGAYSDLELLSWSFSGPINLQLTLESARKFLSTWEIFIRSISFIMPIYTSTTLRKKQMPHPTSHFILSLPIIPLLPLSLHNTNPTTAAAPTNPYKGPILTAAPVNCARVAAVVVVESTTPLPTAGTELLAEARAVKSGVMLPVVVTVPAAEVTNPSTTTGSGEEEVSVRIISMVDVGREVMIVVEEAAKSSSARMVVAAAEGRLGSMVELKGRVKKRRAAQVVMLSPWRRLDIFSQWGKMYGHFGNSIQLPGRRNRQLCSSRRRGSSRSISYISEERCINVWREYFSKSWIIAVARSGITTGDRASTISLLAGEKVTLDYGNTVFRVGSSTVTTVLSEGEASEGRCEAQGNEGLHFGERK